MIIGLDLGLGWCKPGNGTPPTPTIVISGALPAGTIGMAYTGALTVAPSGAPTKISTEDAVMLAGFGLAWNGATSTLSGTLN